MGYIIFEAGSGSITTGSYEAAVGGDTVRGWTNSAPYTYTHSVSAATTVILSAVAMDGADGGWPILDANSPVSATDFDLILQEDDKTGSYEQNHSTEEVAYVVLD